jgi:UPF0716 protein FxsA
LWRKFPGFAFARVDNLCDPRPMGNLLLLFIVVPAVELGLLIEIGKLIGVFETVAIIVLTGAIGASMARNQGLMVLSRLNQQLAAGEMPADTLVDGIMILVAAALLVTPGVLTDIFGFLCLVPGFRARVKGALMRRFEKAVMENRVHVHMSTGSGGAGFESVSRTPEREIKDITPPRGGDGSDSGGRD